MTDREMLELAAKAAGIHIDKSETNGGGRGNTGFDVMGNAVLDWHSGKKWNPLADDGDALRLAVRVGIDVQQFMVAGFCEAWRHPHTACAESFGEDRYAATRRAIVRMAAEIGKQMGGGDV